MDALSWLFFAVTIVLTIDLYEFLHAYRRATHDTSIPYVGPKARGVFLLLVRRHPQAELARRQQLAIGLTVVWLVLAAAELLAPLPAP